jgi:hypothetical protein
MTALAIIYAVMTACLAYMVATAPLGHEDEHGFHYGEP